MDHEECVSDLEDRIVKLEEQLKPAQPIGVKGSESVQISEAVQVQEGVAVIEEAQNEVEEEKVVKESRAEDERRPADRILYEKWRRDRGV